MIVHGIHADAFYRREDLDALGIGPKALLEMRASGVRGRHVGNYVWFHGREIVDYMANQARLQRAIKEAASVGPIESEFGGDCGHEPVGSVGS